MFHVNILICFRIIYMLDIPGNFVSFVPKLNGESYVVYPSPNKKKLLKLLGHGLISFDDIHLVNELSLDRKLEPEAVIAEVFGKTKLKLNFKISNKLLCNLLTFHKHVMKDRIAVFNVLQDSAAIQNVLRSIYSSDETCFTYKRLCQFCPNSINENARHGFLCLLNDGTEKR